MNAQKWMPKLQLTKLYSRLVRLLSGDVADIKGILSALEGTEEMRLEVLQVLEDWIAIYLTKKHKQGVICTEAEIEKVTEDVDREIAIVKEVLSSAMPKVVPTGAPLSNNNYCVDKFLSRFISCRTNYEFSSCCYRLSSYFKC